MSSWLFNKSCRVALGALVIGAVVAGSLAPSFSRADEPSPADEAIQYRQAVYTVLGTNFMPLGAMLQGKAPFNGAVASKSADRVAYLATMVGDAFPEISKNGKTSAKPEIWTHRADFDKKVAALVSSTDALAKLLRKDRTDSAAFKKAAGAVGQSCKSCHDDYKKDE